MKNITICFILACLLFSCYKESDYDLANINPDDVILNIEIENDTILANGISSTKIQVEILLNSDDNLSSVKMITSNGKFQENSLMEITKDAKHIIVNGENKKIAEFALISSVKDGNAELEINVQNVKKTKSVYFKFNYPNKIKTTPSTLLINPSSGEEIEITTKITSSSGYPSIGQKVDLLVKDSVFNQIGTFRVYNNFSNNSNETSYAFSLLPNTTYIGKLYLISSSKVETETLSDTVIIYSKNL